MTQSELRQEFMRGRNCAQCVLGQYADRFGYDQEETDKMLACFGGGMMMGEVCGAVTGALTAIGMAYEDGKKAQEKGVEFTQRFKEKMGSCLCRELLGYNLAVPEQAAQARESGKLLDFCPIPVEEAVSILADMLDN